MGRPKSSFVLDLLRDMYTVDSMQITPIRLPGHICTAYICGPPTFEKHILSLLMIAEVPSLTIHAESFVVEPSATRNISSTLDEALVRFRRSNKEGTWKRGQIYNP